MDAEKKRARVRDTMKALLTERDSVALHAYTPASGLPSLRAAIAADLRERLKAPVSVEGLYVCCGKDAGLAAACRALLAPGEEALALAPVPEELRIYVEAAGGALRTVPAPETLGNAAGRDTRLVILDTAALTHETLAPMLETLRTARARLGHAIYLLAVEPYGSAPALCGYENTVACFPFAEELAMPGERIACLAVSERAEDGADVFARIAGASRAMGYVNTPSLMQRVVERCLDLAAET